MMGFGLNEKDQPIPPPDPGYERVREPVVDVGKSPPPLATALKSLTEYEPSKQKKAE
jgi:hypothetical protein